MVNGLTKTFTGPLPVLDDFCLTLGRGEVHALAGGNGSGKSTFIKILAGYHEPDRGAVTLQGKSFPFGSAAGAYALGARFVHQDLGLVETCSIADNLFLSSGFPVAFGTVRDRDVRRAARLELERVGLDLDPRLLVGSLSRAEQTGVALARALRQDGETPAASLLVLDEPTATLPGDEVEHLLSMIRATAAAGVAVLYVTHRLDEIFLLADTVTVLRDGKRIATRPVEGLDRAALVRLMVDHELEDISAAAASLDPTVRDVVLQVEDLSALGVAGVSFELHASEVVGVAGVTGSGREQLLSAVFGGVARSAHSIRVAGQPLPALRPDRSVAMGLGYLPPDRKAQGGVMGMTACENLLLAERRSPWQRLRKGVERADARSWFERLGVAPARSEQQPLATFSGGNQQKVLLARWLRLEPRVLLLDEPTQGVDLPAKLEIHRQVLAAAEGGAGVLVCSSDVDELAALCHRVYVMREGVLAAHLLGDQVSVSAISAESLGTDRLT